MPDTSSLLKQANELFSSFNAFCDPPFNSVIHINIRVKLFQVQSHCAIRHDQFSLLYTWLSFPVSVFCMPKINQTSIFICFLSSKLNIEILFTLHLNSKNYQNMKLWNDDREKKIIVDVTKSYLIIDCSVLVCSSCFNHTMLRLIRFSIRRRKKCVECHQVQATRCLLS